MKLRLLSYNIRFGGAGHEAELAKAIVGAGPDLVVLQEATRPDVVRRLAERTGMDTWAATPAHSVGFMSRIGIEHHEWHRPRGCRRAFLELALRGTATRVFGVHLSAVHSNWTESTRARELRALLGAIERQRKDFHVLAGDFNTLAPGERLDLRRLPLRLRLLAMLSGSAIRWRTIQLMLDAGYSDAYRLLHPHDQGYTFPTWDPHVRIDFAFLPASATDRLRRCEVVDGVPARTASDHFPLLAELEV